MLPFDITAILEIELLLQTQIIDLPYEYDKISNYS